MSEEDVAAFRVAVFASLVVDVDFLPCIRLTLLVRIQSVLPLQQLSPARTVFPWNVSIYNSAVSRATCGERNSIVLSRRSSCWNERGRNSPGRNLRLDLDQ